MSALALFLTLPFAFGATLHYSDEEALRVAFPNATRFEQRSVPLDEAARARLAGELGYPVRERLVVVREAWQEETLLGRALILEEIGKTLPFRFLTAITPAGAVDQVLVLAYRESRGGEIERNAFRAQYRGKTLDDPIQRGDDIRNVTGATISVDSLSRGVRRALAIERLLDGQDVAAGPVGGTEAGR